MEAPPIGVSVRAWKPAVAGIREVFHARFIDHAYPPHTHDDWTLFIVDDGAIRYDLDRQARGAERSMVTILPPHVVHDGRPATSDGFRKRVLYLETSVLGEHLIGPAVDRPVIVDDGLREPVSALHDALGAPTTPSQAEIAAGLRGRADPRVRSATRRPEARPAPTRDLAEQLRAFLDAHALRTAHDGGRGPEIGASPTRLARSFAASSASRRTRT